LAAGVDPSGLHRDRARSPLDYLSSLIAADGHVRYSRTSDQTPVWVTAEAEMALAEKPLPLTPVARPAKPRRPRSSRPHRAVVPRHVHPRRARERRTAREPTDGGFMMRLASDAAILEALALAPIGVG
jgi:hypothetical protein